MNYEDLSQKITYIQESNGFTLNTEEKAALQSSLVVLKTNSKLHHLFFWGKIFGIQRDYLISQGYTTDDLFGSKKIFCSYNGVDWVQLPEINDETQQLCKKLSGSSRQRFTGDLSHEYTVEVQSNAAPKQPNNQKKAGRSDNNNPEGDEEEEDESEEDDEDEDDDNNDIPKRNDIGLRKNKMVVREEIRLVYIINSIDFDTSIVPRGAVVLTASHWVVANKPFSGLRKAQALNQKFYVHLRQPVTFPKKSLLQREGLSKSLDFLDTMNDDIPNGSWVIMDGKSTPLVTVRSLLWPGFYFYHLPGTSNYGHCYFGFGDKNVDIGFML